MDYTKALEKKTDLILKDKAITDSNKTILLKFKDDCLSEDMSLKRIVKYLRYAYLWAKWLGKDFTKADKEDIKRLVAHICGSNWAEWTKYDNKSMLKKFYKSVEGDGEEYPRKVRWIKPQMKLNKKMLPDELLTVEEVKQMIEAANSMRDKAFISVLFESGCRIGELMEMRLNNIEFDKYGCKIRVHGKTGPRTVRLISSTPYLSNWTSHHPLKNEPSSKVWVSVGTKNHHKPLTYNAYRNMLRDVAERAGVKKRVNPHSFRHARATMLSKNFKERELCLYFGWSKSETASIYVHLNGDHLDDSILRMHGLKEETKQIDRELEPIRCPRCEKINEPDANLCCRCGLPLNEKTALEAERKEKEALKLLTPEMIKQMIDRRVEEKLKNRI
jgi:site-specific recombinase XerD